jgi:hypothetical protein
MPINLLPLNDSKKALIYPHFEPFILALFSVKALIVYSYFNLNP